MRPVVIPVFTRLLEGRAATLLIFCRR